MEKSLRKYFYRCKFRILFAFLICVQCLVLYFYAQMWQKMQIYYLLLMRIIHLCAKMNLCTLRFRLVPFNLFNPCYSDNYWEGEKLLLRCLENQQCVSCKLVAALFNSWMCLVQVFHYILVHFLVFLS